MIAGRPGMYDNTDPWEMTVPAELIPAIEHLRDGFEMAHFGFGQTTQHYCFSLLHKTELNDPDKGHFKYLMHMKSNVGPAATERFHELLKQDTPASSFKAFIDLYLDSLTLEILRIFQELTEIARANQRRLPSPYLRWAQAQATHLIRSHQHSILIWVRDVCDKRPYDPEEDFEEQVYWRKWRAPLFLIMRPSRYHPYDAETAWDRKDAETSSQWLEMFAQHYVVHLQSELREAAGAAALELAKKIEPVGSEAEGSSRSPVALPTTAVGRSVSNSARRDVRKLDSQARYKLWQKKYKELKKDRPDMSDVWVSKLIARSVLAEGHSSETIRKHMTKT